ncbi:DUF4856 domain-containing protein [Aureispira anguillae]|uniref:DUF4856 domain-containing protein n=1 Tax=Aureispira anguillae TaxID=2864201 RepID=A0A916DRD7_9BACT|nr:DUF4856 domain-containing protein [Aureispira anguillae]BDS11769.1 DUF4856 domain-containing protein [Aureispira anguillae]
MKIRIQSLLFLSMILVSLSACQKMANDYTIPTSYQFENVNYDRQKARIKMLTELTDYAKSAGDYSVPHVSKQIMLDMYRNTNAPFSELDLNTTGVELKNKTNPAIQDEIETYISALDSASRCLNVTASVGLSGIMSSSTTNKGYLLNGNGIELAEIIEQLLVSACFYYQITVVHLGETKMNTDNKRVFSGRGTNMEHYWDEAFGYYNVPTNFPSNNSNLSFLGAYSNKVNAYVGSNSRLMDAYLKGRAAISARDYDTRDEMRQLLRIETEKLLAATAISYLNDAKKNTSDLAIYYHHLTQAYGIISGLKYGMQKTLSNIEINNLLVVLAGSADPLEANLYLTTASDIDDVIDTIANSFSTLTPFKDSL